MSLNVLKHKTNALYLKNSSKKRQGKTTYMRPQFSLCCKPSGLRLASYGFSINGGLRPNTYIGKHYMMSKSSQPSLKITDPSHNIKPSVVNHSTLLRRKLRQNGNYVKPIDCGTNKSDNHSQGAYIEKIKSCNSDLLDINRGDKYNNVNAQQNCDCPIIMSKRLKEPLTAAEYLHYLKKPCLKNTPASQGIGKTRCVEKTTCCS